MKIKAKDYLGKPLKVNDTVAFVEFGYRNFKQGKVISVTEKTVLIKIKTARDKLDEEFRQKHDQVIRVKRG